MSRNVPRKIGVRCANVSSGSKAPCAHWNLVYLFCMSKMYVLTEEAALENRDVFKFVCIL